MIHKCKAYSAPFNDDKYPIVVPPLGLSIPLLCCKRTSQRCSFALNTSSWPRSTWGGAIVVASKGTMFFPLHRRFIGKIFTEIGSGFRMESIYLHGKSP